ncbi:hypothetical protein SAMN04487949_1763 [Halogranum gelatinilyticum]|uniref:Uncharacterized protein n=1 Tax=Halogranum gelatinilyticum TaxID=660521 RepID=A0A1G9TH02_9EURY|nr:hypothetical protein [Halogranum gelatinilyticum]SDM46774.1 hypothetical protein SAMN04487949_1763 [Halogranum gelatinilyticum]
MTDEHLLTMAKLREQLRGRIDGEALPHRHGVVTSNREDRTALSFVESIFEPEALDEDVETDVSSFFDDDLGQILARKNSTDVMTDAVHQGNSSVASHLVGVTEQDLDASSMTLPLRILDRLENDGATSFVTGIGNPKTGKTNTMSTIAEMRKIQMGENYLVLSNMRSWDLCDVFVGSAHDLTVALLEHRDVPKFVFVDEGSTHFDARTNSYEVASQWTPLAKRMGKIGTDVCAVVGHTGKDLHPEMKRLTTTAFFKNSKESVDFFSGWNPDSDRPSGALFGGSLEPIEATSSEYDPNDLAPWDWNLQPELFARDLDAAQLLRTLKSQGPAES